MDRETPSSGDVIRLDQGDQHSTEAERAGTDRWLSAERGRKSKAVIFLE